jgi:hypothetical protein
MLPCKTTMGIKTLATGKFLYTNMEMLSVTQPYWRLRGKRRN